jgi:hypothetical protein
VTLALVTLACVPLALRRSAAPGPDRGLAR